LKFWSKIEILVKNWNLVKIEIWSKIEILNVTIFTKISTKFSILTKISVFLSLCNSTTGDLDPAIL